MWALSLRILCATWRKNVNGIDVLDRLLAEGRPHFLIFWHGKYLSLLPLLRDRPARVVTSLSTRGDVLVKVLQVFGLCSIQLPDFGRRYSLELMRDICANELEVGVAVDGPMGPYHAVKRGVVQLASDRNMLIVPVSAAAVRKYTRRRRWDRLEVPWPTTAISLLVGEPLCVPPSLSPRELREWMNRLREILEELDESGNQYGTPS